jgi:NADPH:quinone reductase-like Zn-dependent oxidoreductase
MSIPKTMQAVRFHPPGGPEKLQLASIPVLEPTEPGQILVKVAYTSVIWTELGWPIYQDSTGTYHPATPTRDYAGVVVATAATGMEDSGIEVGSEVMCFPNEWGSVGLRYAGGLAEYALCDVKCAVLKPQDVRLVDAASVPLSALTAWQGLFDQPEKPLAKGMKVLVTGAAGSTGTWAVQFAKRVGATVVGTASSEWSKRTLKELGCDEIVDYKTQAPLSDYMEEVDLVLDTVGGEKTLAELPKVLKTGGEVVSIVTYDVEQQMKEKGVRAKFFIWTQNASQMGNIAEMIRKRELKCFVDSVFPMEKAEEAYRKAQEGHLQGKVMVEVGGEDAST